MISRSKKKGLMDDNFSITRETIYAYFSARQSQQCLNTFTKDDCWKKHPHPWIGPGATSQIITKNDYYTCQKLVSFDVQFVNETLNYLSSKYWLPFPHLSLDDKCDDFKGKHPCKQFRVRKPKPNVLVGYAIVDSEHYRVSYIPRFHPYSPITRNYAAYKKQWEKYYEDPSKPKPLPFKKAYPSSSKTSFDLPNALIHLLSYLPVDNNAPFHSSTFNSIGLKERMVRKNFQFYDVTLDREFGTVKLLNLFREFRGLGYNFGFKANNFNCVFTYFLNLQLEEQKTYGQWRTISSKKDLALSFHSSEICSFVSNISYNKFVEDGDQKIPSIVSNFRKRMRFVDLHDQRCNYLNYPFKVRSGKERLWNSWERSMQINSEIIYNYGRTKQEQISSKDLLLSRVKDLSEGYRIQKSWDELNILESIFFYYSRANFSFSSTQKKNPLSAQTPCNPCSGQQVNQVRSLFKFCSFVSLFTM
jgi:hypothetical protein